MTEKYDMEKYENQTEWSGALGIALVCLSIGSYIGWYLHGADWAWKLVAAGGYACVGLMLLHPDIRLIQYGKPPIEKWMEADDDFEQ